MDEHLRQRMKLVLCALIMVRDIMGRKKDIEGQLNFLDMLVNSSVEEEIASEVEGTEQLQEANDERQESAKVEREAESAEQSQVEKQKVTVKKVNKSFKAGGFKECASCWCATCEHSTLGGSVPRPLGDGMRPCPACELCIRAGKAEICVIGSADEGCRHRAEKEGLV